MPFDDEQKTNAQIIQQVGRSVGASQRDILIALMTAMQESGLHNVNYGDRDSIGLFQQRRPWGTDAQRMDPAESARMFFQGGHTGEPGLFSKKNRDQMSLTEAAQAVQVSAFPDAYAKHERGARELMGVSVGPVVAGGTATAQTAPGEAPPAPEPTGPGVGPSARQLIEGKPNAGLNTIDATPLAAEPIASADGGSDFLPRMSQTEFASSLGGMQLPGPFSPEAAPVSATGMRKKVVDYAMGMIGTPYMWGGSSRTGVDCSGLIQLAYGQFGVDLPRISYQQATYGRQLNQQQAKPGDLWATENSARNHGADHVAMYLGDGWIVEAPKPGEAVRKRKLSADEEGWFVDMSRATGA